MVAADGRTVFSREDVLGGMNVYQCYGAGREVTEGSLLVPRSDDAESAPVRWASAGSVFEGGEP